MKNSSLAQEPDKNIRLQLKIADISDNKLEAVVQMALIQNCLSGIRGNSIFGLAIGSLDAEAGETNHTAHTLTMDVYTCFGGLNQNMQTEHVQALKDHLQFQLNRLLQNLDQKANQQLALKMAPPPVRRARPASIPFDTYRWKQLLGDMVALCEPGNAELLVQSGLVRVNGKDMQLTYQEHSPQVFELRVDLGAVPAELNQLDIFKSLLIHNCMSGDESGLWWGVHPSGNRVIMVIEHELSGSEKHFSAPSAHDMLALLKDTANQTSTMWATLTRAVTIAQAM